MAETLQGFPRRPLSPRISRRSSELDRRPGERAILVPVDDAEECEQALQWALSHFAKPGDTYYLFHIIPGAQGVHSTAFTSPSKHQSELQKDQADHMIEERFLPLLEQAQAKYEVCVVRGHLDRQSIGEAICNKASDLCAALVIMSAHTRGAMVRYIIGSTTQYCIEHCDKTVMVMHD